LISLLLPKTKSRKRNNTFFPAFTFSHICMVMVDNTYYEQSSLLADLIQQGFCKKNNLLFSATSTWDQVDGIMYSGDSKQASWSVMHPQTKEIFSWSGDSGKWIVEMKSCNLRLDDIYKGGFLEIEKLDFLYERAKQEKGRAVVIYIFACGNVKYFDLGNENIWQAGHWERQKKITGQPFTKEKRNDLCLKLLHNKSFHNHQLPHPLRWYVGYFKLNVVDKTKNNHN